MSRSFLLVVHLAAVISWMAGILYLYRLFIYHRDEPERVVRERFQIMERRLYRGITVPAMIFSFAAGLGLVYQMPNYYLVAPWFWAKFSAALLLMLSTLYAGYVRQQLLANPEVVVTSKALRWLNEVPTVLMIIILVMVFYKPWS